jgi:DNA replication initiation complex subunit (GINS family)
VREVEDEIERALLAERLSSQLTKLPEDFYARASQFLSSLEGGGTELEREELAEKKKVLLRMLEELLKLRVRKALNSLPALPDNLLASERPYLETIQENLRKMRASLLSVQGKEQLMDFVLLTDKIPRIVAEDMKFYGPFSKGDVAAIPKRTAEILVRKGLAKRIEMRI